MYIHKKTIGKKRYLAIFYNFSKLFTSDVIMFKYICIKEKKNKIYIDVLVISLLLKDVLVFKTIYGDKNTSVLFVSDCPFLLFWIETTLLVLRK